MLADTHPPPRTRQTAAERRRTVRELRQAASGREFQLLFQPRHSLVTGRLCGAEASLRWPRRKAGVTPPGGLLPLLEQCGLMPEVTAWMLAEACREAVLWASPLALSLDMPAAMVAGGAVAGEIATILAEADLPPGRLELEIDESGLNDAPLAMLLTLGALRDLGVGTALDHFGSASAGLLAPKLLPLTTLILDRALVRDLPHDREAEAAIAAATAFAHALDMKVVALGIDTNGQLRTLSRLGCDEGQGALFGPPLATDAFRRLADTKPPP